MAGSLRFRALNEASFGHGYLRFCDWSYGRAREWLLPDLLNSQYSYAAALRGALERSGRWLDIGCGHGFVPDWLNEQERHLDLRRWTIVGADLDHEALKSHQHLRMRVHANGERLPFSDGAFSLITANMVLEHVQNPAELFAEISRVLVPGGTLLVHTPNVRGYTTQLARLIPSRFLARAAVLMLGRKSEDVYPTYYRANSAHDLEGLAGHHRFDAVLDHVLSSPQFLRLPPLMLLEMVWLRLLGRPTRYARRPCIVARFRKLEPDGAG